VHSVATTPESRVRNGLKCALKKKCAIYHYRARCALLQKARSANQEFFRTLAIAVILSAAKDPALPSVM
jgi:hypothetical protein